MTFDEHCDFIRANTIQDNSWLKEFNASNLLTKEDFEKDPIFKEVLKSWFEISKDKFSDEISVYDLFFCVSVFKGKITCILSLLKNNLTDIFTVYGGDVPDEDCCFFELFLDKIKNILNNIEDYKDNLLVMKR